jgi:hypothetical protein
LDFVTLAAPLQVRRRQSWRAACSVPTPSRGGVPCRDVENMPYGFYISAEGAQAQARRMQKLLERKTQVQVNLNAGKSYLTEHYRPCQL